MATETMAGQAAQVEAAAERAGLVATQVEPGTDFTGQPTVRYVVSRPEDPSRTQGVELSAAFDPAMDPGAGRGPELVTQVQVYFAEVAKRLRNPRPDCFLTLGGLPLSFGRFAWPFHLSTSGADTFIVHGEVRLEDGQQPTVLHAKIAASLTVTFKEIVPAMEQPFAEGVIYNAVRKTMDQGQLELVKSGNRQPVPVTTRYYSTKQGRFVFNDTSETQRSEFLAGKVFWLSGVLGGGREVWLLDPRDAQYLNTTVAELRLTAENLAAEGLLLLAADTEFGTPTEALMGLQAKYVADMQEALLFTKPTFNEEMRSGQTNM